MSERIFVVSEWLPKEGREQELWSFFKDLMAMTLEKEKGCIRANATRQIAHPSATGKSKFTITLLQEYTDSQAFDIHCASDYVVNAFKKFIENEETAIIAEWRCRIFSDKDEI